MESVRIKNLRSFEDTKDINLKPITLLVGANGSGKSSFLRFFPLMRQSYSRRINGPILWREGEKGLVDFGDYATAINHNINKKDEETNIIFSICYKSRIRNTRAKGSFSKRKQQEICVTVEIGNRARKKEDFVKRLDLTIGKQKIRIEFDSKKNFINEVYVNSEKIEIKGKLEITNSFIPKIKRNFISPNTFEDYEILSRIIETDLPADMNKYYFYGDIIEALLQVAFNHSDYEGFKNEVDKAITDSRLKIKEKLISSEEDYGRLVKELIAWELSDILRDIDLQVDRMCSNVHYITPLRANAERYAPANNLAVDEIDSKGENMAVFLNSMENKKGFQEWTLKHFGFCADVLPSEGHLSVVIGRDRKKGSGINLADTGFGYSQILPIVAQLWTILEREPIYRPIRVASIIFAIEQPELHLHPAVQAKLIDVFADSIHIARKKKIDLKIIMETHSETMINRIGSDIYKKKILKEDVNLVIFEKQEKKTYVSETGYDEDGYVIDWPSGFFLPEED